MPEFKFVPGKGVVRVSEEVVNDEELADQLQEQVGVAQQTLSERQARHQQTHSEWEEAEMATKSLKLQLEEAETEAANKAHELETALSDLHAAEEDLKSAETGRDTFAEARALQSQMAESRPENETDENESSEVDVTDRIHTAEEAAA